RETPRARLPAPSISYDVLLGADGRCCRCGCGALVLPFDSLELVLVALADRPLEPLPGREQVPATEEQERCAHHDHRVVEEGPGEPLVPRDPAVGGRKDEGDADESDPEDREPIDPLVVTAEVPG